MLAMLMAYENLLIYGANVVIYTITASNYTNIYIHSRAR